ncbi:MAG: hypothetical protein HY849_06920 [Nitrosomonadales bacterium]|nr:hypothetical protein [Nitrosomonadales bacterium]
MKRCYAALLVLASIPPCAAQELGRLFFNPEQRAQLERSTSPQKPLPPLLNGIVQKCDGSRTIWLDGMAQSASDEPSPSRQHLEFPERGKLSLTVGERLREDAAH